MNLNLPANVPSGEQVKQSGRTVQRWAGL